MSTDSNREIAGFNQAPYVGALLRLVHGRARGRILQILDERGMGELGPTYFSLFQYPGVDGMRLIDIAKRLGITKQALNHLVGQLERLGYLQRHAEPGGRHTTLRYTERGWLVFETSIQTMQSLEAEWQAYLGKRQFAEFKATLKQLAGIDEGTT